MPISNILNSFSSNFYHFSYRVKDQLLNEKIAQNALHIFKNIAQVYLIYSLIDQGLANLLCLETLRHGTNLSGFIGIQFTGGNPKYGGNDKGSSQGNMNLDKYSPDHKFLSKGYFYTFKDSDFALNYPEKKVNKLANYIEKRFCARVHAVIAGYSHNSPSLFNKIRGIIGSGISLFIPIVKFRFSEIPQELENDPQYSFKAYRTTHKIGISHLGILGSLIQGINKDLFNRISKNPKKACIGVLQLGVAAFLMVSFCKIAPKSDIALIAWRVMNVVGTIIAIESTL